VYQLPRGVTLVYNLYLGCTISRWKCIEKELHFKVLNMPSIIIEVPDHEKVPFRLSKWPKKFRTKKNAKNSKLPKSCFKPDGIGGWPPISTYIIKCILV
jgi:hypothetical protein